MDLKEKLSYLMKQNNIKNLYDLSRQCDIPYTTLRNIMIDNISNVKIETAMKLCKFFNISLDELFSEHIDISEIQLASYNGINIEGLNITDIEEVNEFINYVKSKKEKK